MVAVKWHGDSVPTGTKVRLLFDSETMSMRVFSIDLEPLGILPVRWGAEPSGICLGEVATPPQMLSITYFGPKDLFSERTAS
jgi:hypothetical protein